MTAITLELDSTRTRSPSRVDWKRYAACYDLLAAINPAYVQLLEEFRAFCRVNLREGMRILDLGGGTGNFFCHALPDELKDRCALIHLDSDAEMISMAREKYRQHGLKVELVHRDASRTVFPAGHFDCIISVNALYAMPTPIQILRRTLRWLRPGASFFLVDLGRVLDTREWRSFLVKSNIPRMGALRTFRTLLKEGSVIAKANREIVECQRDGTYWQHTTEELRAILEKVGFELDDVRPVYRGYSDLAYGHRPLLRP
jgi:ubiquinone/menaquinone biosynthesis C-methylase UbiE